MRRTTGQIIHRQLLIKNPVGSDLPTGFFGILLIPDDYFAGFESSLSLNSQEVHAFGKLAQVNGISMNGIFRMHQSARIGINLKQEFCVFRIIHLHGNSVNRRNGIHLEGQIFICVPNACLNDVVTITGTCWVRVPP